MKDIKFIPNRIMWHLYSSSMDVFDIEEDCYQELKNSFFCHGCCFPIAGNEEAPSIIVLQRIPKNLDMAPFGLCLGVISQIVRNALAEEGITSLNFGTIILFKNKEILPHQVFTGKGRLIFLRGVNPNLPDGTPIHCRLCPTCKREILGGLGQRYLFEDEIDTTVPIGWTSFGGILITPELKTRLEQYKFRGVRFEKIKIAQR